MREKGGIAVETIRLAPERELDIVKTFECGQCFRWNADETGAYTGVVRGQAARVWKEDGWVLLRSDAPETMWRDYFDLERDYGAISRGFQGGEYLNRCVQYGMGIRILRQEPWETLCSFILSQCNNIKRIKGIVERLCQGFGEPVPFDEQVFYRFPGPEKLACLAPEDLDFLRCGYRAPYLISAARRVCDRETALDSLISADVASAKKALIQIDGVGEKVANCVVLFGLYHMEAFPVDVWIKRALKEHFPAGFDPASLGRYAGLAQQYIFYYARSGEV